MRIAVDGTPLLGDRSGVGWYTAELIRALVRVSPGDEVAAWPITWRRPGSADDVAPAKLAGPRMPARALWAFWRRGRFPPLEWFVRADVFHGTNFLAPPSRSTPIVVTVHDLGFVRHPQLVLERTRRDYLDMLPRVLGRAAAVIAVSAFTRDELASWMPSVASKVTVVHEAAHARPSVPEPSGAGDAPYALFVGTLDPRKNLGLLLDALALLRSRGRPLRAVLAGSASPLVDVPREAARRGLRPEDVELTGYAGDRRVAELLRGARVLAHPSLYEGFGMPPLEAMAAGVPVVAARAGSTPEVVGDAALLVDPGDAEAFADALDRAVNDETVRARLIEAGRGRAASFTWDDTARATLDVYRSVAE